MIADYLAAVWTIVLELAPWLLLGTAVAGALHVLMPRDFIRRHLGGRGAWTTVKAAVVGVPMPLCSCSVIPTGLGLRRDGAGRGAAVSFLISTPQTGVDSVAVTAAFLGWPFALFKLAAAFLTGVVGGLATNAVTPEDPPAPQPVSTASRERRSPAAALRAGLLFGLDLLRMIWRWLVFGVVVSALITVLIEPGSLDFEGAGGGLVAMLLSLVISLPLYVCATASVPIAAALVHAGLPTGAALVFLMAGPATNIATMGAIARGLGGRAVTVYLATIVVGSVGLGLAYEAWIGLESVTLGEHVHDHATWWAFASAVLLCVLLAWFVIEDLRRWVTPSRTTQGTAGGCCAAPPAAAQPAGCCGSVNAEPLPQPAGCCGSVNAEPVPQADGCCETTTPASASQAPTCCGSPKPTARRGGCCGG